MRKTTLLLVTLTLMAGAVNAAPVTEATARRVAVNFWNTYRPVEAKPVTDMQSLPFSELSHLYVFANDTNGFVIVTGDDRVRPVVGYSFNTPFPTRLHPALLYWLRCYEDQIAQAQTMAVGADPRWSTLMDENEVPPMPVSLQHVSALCKTQWDQGEPFNRLCPYDSVYYSRTVVGCVATAMAQIMKYWEHPFCGTGSHSYIHEPWSGGVSYGLLSADFEHTTYMWEMMPLKIVISTSDAKAHALSVLSYHCGVAVDMIYGTSAVGGSGAYSSCGDWTTACAEQAFSRYFKYDGTSIHYLERNRDVWRDSVRIVDGVPETVYYILDSTLISDSVWLSMIDEELANGRPIYYDGSDNSGGHAFILDGSNLDTCYHFNWGWSGYGDGFYAMNNLAPGSGGAGGNATYTFNHGQGAIFGIKPLPEPLDTIVLYDTICSNYTTFYKYDYQLAVADCDTMLHHLDTVIDYHLHVINPHTLTFKSNTGGFGEAMDMTYCTVDGVVMPECTWTKSGYNFIGWCRKKKRTADDPLYQPGELVYLTGNIPLYAQWRDTADTVGIVTVEPNAVNLWPNPTTGEVTVTVDEDHEAQVLLIDAMGRTVLRDSMRGNKKINLAELPNGTYTVQVRTSAGVYNQRLIKQ